MRRPNGSGWNSRLRTSPGCSFFTRAIATTDFSAWAMTSTRTFSIAAAASRPVSSEPLGSCAGARVVSPSSRDQADAERSGGNGFDGPWVADRVWWCRRIAEHCHLPLYPVAGGIPGGHPAGWRRNRDPGTDRPSDVIPPPAPGPSRRGPAP